MNRVLALAASSAAAFVAGSVLASLTPPPRSTRTTTGRPAEVPPMTPQYGCAGLCGGDGCADCSGLADEITAAKQITDPDEREARLTELEQQINALHPPKEGQ
ncbi:hypothetical protein [Actinomadura litoris]|uniref:Secreted protein n=1 Tax=Actinomadura litoris TaxID=2678616 RepID=A0A7K1LAY3_9ACTN|nr:hypothetical protein [Actinomadura litoris]MUN41483.1 hypothetical protein [Actinomadura litoris]